MGPKGDPGFEGGKGSPGRQACCFLFSFVILAFVKQFVWNVSSLDLIKL